MKEELIIRACTNGTWEICVKPTAQEEDGFQGGLVWQA